MFGQAVIFRHFEMAGAFIGRRIIFRAVDNSLHEALVYFTIGHGSGVASKRLDH